VLTDLPLNKDVSRMDVIAAPSVLSFNAFCMSSYLTHSSLNMPAPLFFEMRM
jgi:hypothetical protein